MSGFVGILNLDGAPVVTADQPDVELILHAYRVWGERCVEYLIGDFAFAIWDACQQFLFCARDHWGVRPFYYAQVGNCLVFSNVLNCIRIYPTVSDELNEQFIGDFLLFGANQEVDTTVFSDIKRLPPAHYLIYSERSLSLHHYWSLPTELPTIRYKQATDYVEHFRELLELAVADRLRTDRVAVGMSGGLDSSSVAATALALRSKGSVPFDLQAFTVVYDSLIPDQERYYSGLVAQSLNIPIHYLVVDDYLPYERWNQPELYQPEPIHHPGLAVTIDSFRDITQYSRVSLTGWDGDTILNESIGPYFGSLLVGWRWRQAIVEMGQYVWSQRRPPPIGFRTLVKRMRQRSYSQSAYPLWLNDSFALRVNLPTRWRQINEKRESKHPLRPKVYETLRSSRWSQLFECQSAGVTQLPHEVRHPLTDVRLVKYALSIPLSPWAVNKQLFRVAMRGLLPETIRLRPKAPLAKDPLLEQVKSGGTKWLDNYKPMSRLMDYVNLDTVPKIDDQSNANALWTILRPLSLNYWLQNLTSINYQFRRDQEDEYAIEG
jgi:asparagine synthase (glutamine-hydrolysing)